MEELHMPSQPASIAADDAACAADGSNSATATSRFVTESRRLWVLGCRSLDMLNAGAHEELTAKVKTASQLEAARCQSGSASCTSNVPLRSGISFGLPETAKSEGRWYADVHSTYFAGLPGSCAPGTPIPRAVFSKSVVLLSASGIGREVR